MSHIEDTWFVHPNCQCIHCQNHDYLENFEVCVCACVCVTLLRGCNSVTLSVVNS